MTAALTICSSFLPPPLPCVISAYQNPLLSATDFHANIVGFISRSLSARLLCYFRTPVFRCVSHTSDCRLIFLCGERTRLVRRNAAIGIFTAICGQNDGKLTILPTIRYHADLPSYLFCVAITRLCGCLRVRRVRGLARIVLYKTQNAMKGECYESSGT